MRITICDQCEERIPEPDSRPKDIPPTITLRGGLGSHDFCCVDCLAEWSMDQKPIASP